MLDEYVVEHCLSFMIQEQPNILTNDLDTKCMNRSDDGIKCMW